MNRFYFDKILGIKLLFCQSLLNLIMKISLIIIALFLNSFTFGQVKEKKAPPVESSSSYRFGRVSNINLSSRLKKYPFNKAVKIQLVSFVDPTGGGPRESKIKIVYNPNMPKSNMAVCINPFKEIKNLSNVQIDKLTDIWFNFDSLGDNHITNFSPCYAPKNAILFFDERGKVFDFIEICFSCLHMYDFSKKIKA